MTSIRTFFLVYWREREGGGERERGREREGEREGGRERERKDGSHACNGNKV